MWWMKISKDVIKLGRAFAYLVLLDLAAWEQKTSFTKLACLTKKTDVNKQTQSYYSSGDVLCSSAGHELSLSMTWCFANI